MKREKPLANDKAGKARKRSGPWEFVASDWRELGDFLQAFLAESEIKPKYEALRAALAEAIHRELIGRQGKLPTEKELVELVPFGLATVQRALRGLTDSGLIARKPGVGTIVVPVKWQIEQPLHLNLQDMEGNQAPLTSRVLSRRKVTGKGRWRDFLGDAEQVYVIQRLHMAAGDLPIYSEYYVDVAAYPVFLWKPLSELSNENLRHIFSRELGRVVDNITSRIVAVPAPAEVASHLNIKRNVVCLRQQATATSGSKVLYYAAFWIPPNPYELVIESNL